MTLYSTQSPHAGKILAAGAAVGLLSSLIGCSLGGSSLSSPAGSAQAAPSSSAAVTFQGRVHGGNQPVSGAKVTIYVAGVNTPSAVGVTPAVTGYGSGATSLATTTTDANGNFNFPAGTYTCPAPSQQAYIVATGGNPGLGGAVNNANLALMAALGACPAGGNLIATVPSININEVTTVAAVWALQQFMSPPAATTSGMPNLGAPNTAYSNGLSGASALSVQSAVVGLNNAFITARVLADISTGLSPNTNYPYAKPEAIKINTVADILAFCINSDPTASTNCSILLAAATPAGQTAAADTIQAAWYMAQNPTNNLPALFSFVAGAGAPFVPTNTAPTTSIGAYTPPTAIAGGDWNDTTIAINYEPTYSNGGTTTPVVGAPFDVAIDAGGNAWISNTGYSPTSSGFTTYPSVPASVAELGVDGSVLVAPITTFTVSSTNGAASTTQLPTLPASSTATISAPKSIAIDLTNRPWVTNNGFNPLGGAKQTSPVAVFTASSASGIGGTGGLATSSNTTGYWVGYQSFGIAIDGTNNVFITNAGNNSGYTSPLSIAKMSGVDGSSYTSSNSVTPGGQILLAVDTNTNLSTGGTVWMAAQAGCKFTGLYYGDGAAATDYGLIQQINPTTAAPTFAPSGNLTTADSGIVTGFGTGTNCGVTTSRALQTFTAHMSNPYGIAIDRNNGVWLTNYNNGITSGGFDGLTYLVGPTASTGAVFASFSLVNGALPSTIASGTSTTAAAGTTMQKPTGVAVDGNNNAWIISNHANGIAEASVNTISGTISLLTPGVGAAIGTSATAAYGLPFAHFTSNASSLAIDPSGNVWVANTESAGTNSTNYASQAGPLVLPGNSMTVLVGAAGPVITPRSLALRYNKLATKP